MKRQQSVKIERRKGDKRRKRPRLTIMLIPRGSWETTCHTKEKLSKDTWLEAREKCYIEAEYTCKICGEARPTHAVGCQGRWAYNSRTKTQTLVGLIILCPACCEVMYFDRSAKKRVGMRVIKRLQWVNGWDYYTAEDYIRECLEEHATKRQVKWADVSFAWKHLAGDVVSLIRKGSACGSEIR